MPVYNKSEKLPKFFIIYIDGDEQEVIGATNDSGEIRDLVLEDLNDTCGESETSASPGRYIVYVPVSEVEIKVNFELTPLTDNKDNQQ
jgi:hypothetical protein